MTITSLLSNNEIVLSVGSISIGGGDGLVWVLIGIIIALAFSK